MRTRLTVAVVCIAALLAAVPVVAHHSFAAEYDAEKPIKLTGTVTKIEWTNPHCFFYVDVKNEASGKTENWGFEMGNPNALLRTGLDAQLAEAWVTRSLSREAARETAACMPTPGQWSW